MHKLFWVMIKNIPIFINSWFPSAPFKTILPVFLPRKDFFTIDHFEATGKEPPPFRQD
jgi:hypothetical protein